MPPGSPPPQVSQGHTPVAVECRLVPQGSDGWADFRVTSVPVRQKPDEDGSTMLEHCVGRVLKTPGASVEEAMAVTLLPGSHGLMTRVDELRDLSAEEMADLHHRHSEMVYSSADSFYGSVNVEGLMEYGKSFRCVQSIHRDPARETMWHKLDFDQGAVDREGGCYSPQMLDCCLQVFLTAARAMRSTSSWLMGGAESYHFLRKPDGDTIYVHTVWDTDVFLVGRRVNHGHLMAYSPDGKLIFTIRNAFGIVAKVEDNYRICKPLWQPLAASSPQDWEALTALTAGDEAADEWSSEANQRLTAWVDHREDDPPAWPLEEPPLSALASGLRAGETPELEASQVALLCHAATLHAREARVVALGLSTYLARVPGRVVRVLEVIPPGTERAVVELVDWAAAAAAGVVIEYFLIGPDSKALKQVGASVPRNGAIRVRRAAVALHGAGLEALADWPMDALVLSGGGSSNGGIDSLDAFLALANPAAMVWVRGVAPPAAWLKALIPAVATSEETPTGEAFVTALQNRGCATLVPLSDVAGQGVVVARLGEELRPTDQPGRYVVAAERQEDALQVAEALASACAGQDSAVPVLLDVDPSATATATQEEVTARLTAIVEDRTDGLPPVRGVVYVTAEEGEAPINKAGIRSLTRVGQAVAKIAKAVTPAPGEGRLSFVVLSRGAAVGAVRAAQGCNSGFLTGYASEVTDVECRLIDVAPGADLKVTAPVIIAERPREMTVGVEADGRLVARRFSAVDREDIRQVTVTPDGPMSYACELRRAEEAQVGHTLSNMFFNAREVSLPAPGEVTVQVHATALNFRDVMVGMSLLPRKSYEGSFYGRTLGLEAAGVVTAVGEVRRRGEACG
jgi:hypothetical protein